MSHAYTAVQWNKHKKVYDLVLWALILLYLTGFIGVSLVTHPGDHAIHPPVLLLRALGTLSLLLLTVTLSIGPLVRLSPRFAPLLYNRRHLGVSLFCLALLHGLAAVGFYHGFGVTNPIRSLFTSNTNYTSLVGFPFETLGVLALAIFFLMAATSHDFWLKNLSARWWKTLHMLVYVAYGLVILHVALGALQSERSPVYVILTAASLGLVTGLHILAGAKEHRADRERAAPANEGWVDAGAVETFEPDAAKVVRLSQTHRVAVVRHGERGELLSCVSNVCKHQGGPLGEGRVVDGCLTCPWHGYQYLPAEGQSPPPFTETIPTYRIKVQSGRVLVHPQALPEGTAVEPAPVEENP